MNYPKTERFLLKIVRLCIFAAIFTPLIYTESTLFPFIVGKVVYLEAVVGAAAGAYLLLLLVNPIWRPRMSLLLRAVILYIVVLFIATLTGVDFVRSFWANFERMTGWFALLHYFLLFVIAASVFPDKLQRVRLLKTTLFVSLLVSLSAYYSLLKPGFLFQTGGLAKLWGTLGNSIYLGNYMSIHLFFAALLYLENVPRRWKIFAVLVGIFDFLGFVSAETRGAMVGFFGAIALAVIFSFFAVKNKKVKIWILCVIVTVSALGAFLRINQSQGWVQKIPALRRLVSISLTGGTMATRGIAWNIAIESWKERPVFGWGPENFYYAFNKYYNPKSLEFSYYETWFDRAHNVVFDHLVFGGAAGLLAYLGIFAAAVYSLFRRWREGKIGYGIFICSASVFVATFVQKLTVFDEPSSYLILFLSLAYAETLISDPREQKAQPKNAPARRSLGAGGPPAPRLGGSVIGIAAVFIIIMTISLIYGGSIRTLRASQKLLDAERASTQGLKAAIPAYKDALQYGTPYIKDLEQDLVKRLTELAQAGGADQETINEAFQLAKGTSDDMIKRHPRDVYSYILTGQLDNLMAYYDAKYIAEAEWAYGKAAELSPKRQQIYYSWGKLRLAKQDFAGAVEILRRALDFNPNIADSHWYVGLAESMAGNKEAARTEIEEAIKRNYQWKSPYEQAFAGDIYANLKDYETALKYYEMAIAAGGQGEIFYRAARAAALAGDKKKAREYAEKSIAGAPPANVDEIRRFINSL